MDFSSFFLLTLSSGLQLHEVLSLSRWFTYANLYSESSFWVPGSDRHPPLGLSTWMPPRCLRITCSLLRFSSLTRSRTPPLGVFSSGDNHQTSHGPSGSCGWEARLCRVTHCWQPFALAHINPQSKVLHPALLTPPWLPVHIFYFWNTSDLTHSSSSSGLMSNPDHSGFYVSDESLFSVLNTWQRQLKKGRYPLCSIAQGSHPAWWGRLGSLKPRELVPSASEVRKKRKTRMLVLNSLPPVYSVQDPKTGDVTSHIWSESSHPS